MSYQEAKKRILASQKDSPGKSQKEAQLAPNFNPFAGPEVRKIELTLGNIPNPFEIYQVSPVHSSGEWPYAQWLQTWINPVGPSQKCLRTH